MGRAGTRPRGRALRRAGLHVLIGAVLHSERFRAVSCEHLAFGHLAETACSSRLAARPGRGGPPSGWPRSSCPAQTPLTVDAAQAAKHHGVDIAVSSRGGTLRYDARNQGALDALL